MSLETYSFLYFYLCMYVALSQGFNEYKNEEQIQSFFQLEFPFFPTNSARKLKSRRFDLSWRHMSFSKDLKSWSQPYRRNQV